MANHTIDWSGYDKTGDSYESLPVLLGAEVLAWVDENDYQGESFALMRHDSEYGYLCFGWGSCSVCDAMQSADGDRDATIAVFEDLLRSIHWFPTLAEAKVHVAGIDGTRHEYHADEFAEFRAEVSELQERAA